MIFSNSISLIPIVKTFLTPFGSRKTSMHVGDTDAGWWQSGEEPEESLFKRLKK